MTRSCVSKCCKYWEALAHLQWLPSYHLEYDKALFLTVFFTQKRLMSNSLMGLTAQRLQEEPKLIPRQEEDSTRLSFFRCRERGSHVSAPSPLTHVTCFEAGTPKVGWIEE